MDQNKKAIKVTIDADNIRYLNTVLKMWIYFVVHLFYMRLLLYPHNFLLKNHACFNQFAHAKVIELFAFPILTMNVPDEG